MALTAVEQYMLERINQSRLDPAGTAARYGIGLNDGIAALGHGSPISAAPKEVLAANGALERAATDHSLWQLGAGAFSHTGAGGSQPDERIEAAGYAPPHSGYSWAENIARLISSAAIRDLPSVVDQMLEGLFRSPGHRVNTMAENVREIGIGFELGSYGSNNAAIATEDFGAQGNAVFLTGVAYADRDRDAFYSVGEGQRDTVFRIGSSITQSNAVGGYGLEIAPADNVAVIVRQGTLRSELRVDLGDGNVKLDLVDGKLIKSSGDLTLVSGVAQATLLGVADLRLTGNAAANLLTGNAGKNLIAGADGNDVIRGAAGNDTLIGGGHNDRLNGDAGYDLLQGDSGSDVLIGGWGNDRLFGGDHRDQLFGQDGNDWLAGGIGNDLLRGDRGNDVLFGDIHDDRLLAGPGDDRLYGGPGTDALSGDSGNDLLSGGPGTDRFIFAPGFGHDRLNDFADNVDTLVLDDALWGGRALSPAEVIAAYGTAAGTDTVLDFGARGDLRLVGLTDPSVLVDDITII